MGQIGNILKQKLPYIFFSLCALFLSYKRIQLDEKDYPFIQSDAQIKLYQTANYSQYGLWNHKCLYPGREIDPDFQFFPFDYPWAISGNGGSLKEDCYFQYPSYFSYLTLPVYRYLGLHGLNWFSFLFYVFASLLILIHLKYLTRLQNPIFLSFLVFLSLSGYPIYSGYEYSETTVGVFLFLLLFLLLTQEQNSLVSKDEANTPVSPQYRILSFLAGFFVSLAPFLRSELFIYLFFYVAISLVLSKQNVLILFRKNRGLVFGLLAGLTFFAIWNFIEFGHIFGVRGRLSLADMGEKTVVDRLFLVKDFFLGNQHKVGWIRSASVLLIIIITLLFLSRKHLKENAHLLILPISGMISLLTISILSPYNPGGLFAGLRFTDLSFYMFIVTIGQLLAFVESKEPLLWKNKLLLSVLVFFLILQTFLQIRILKKFFPLLDTVRNAQVELLKRWEVGGNLPVLHKNLFDGILISTSYLTQFHFLVLAESDAKKIQSLLAKEKISGFHLIWYDGEKPYDRNFSRKMYDEKINNKYDFPEVEYKLTKDDSKYGYRLQQFSLK
ncbi:MAG: hypothetical protein O9301_10880 [Leptospira sp.]|nr:hypothetical protein [Leptospira sp.]